MLEYICIFILSCFVLAKSGGWVVKSLSNISRLLRWREFIVASIVMAIGSSLPELFVGITSSIKGNPQLSAGNILGSNILALSFVIGLGAVLAFKLKFKGEIIKRTKFFALFYTLLPLVLILDNGLSRIDGLILIISFILYLRELVNQQKAFSKEFAGLNLKDWAQLRLLLKAIGIFFFSLFLLLISAQGIVFSAVNIAEASGLSLVIIGILGIAIGTSLPEIIFALKTIQLGHKQMVIGNAIGSVVVNAGLILGITALIAPFKIQHSPLYLNSIVFGLIALFFFLIFSRSKEEIDRKEGIVLISLYLIFFIVETILEMFG